MTTTPTLQELPVNGLKPSPHNPRRELSGPALDELADSIKALGVLEPLLVRYQGGKGYEILAGHRRAQAAKKAGLASVPCIVRDVDDKTAIEITVTENLQREQLSPLEEAHALESLSKAGWDATTMAAELGKSPTWVARRMSLLNLAPVLRNAVQSGGAVKFKDQWGGPRQVAHFDQWPARSLELLSSVHPDSQLLVLEDVWDGLGGGDNVPLPVDVKRAVSETLKVLSAAPFDKTDPTLNPKQGACTACDLRSSCRRSLFDDAPQAEDGKIPRNDQCLNPACFAAKLVEHGKRQIEAARKDHGAAAVVVSARAETRKAFKSERSYMPDYGMKQVKPGAEGAKFYYDADTGQGKWLAEGREHSPKSGKRGKGTVTPLSVRRHEYAQRRLAHCIKAIQAEIEKWDRFPTDGAWGELRAQYAALLVFGTSYGSAEREAGPITLDVPGKAGKRKTEQVDPWVQHEKTLLVGFNDLEPDSDEARIIAWRMFNHLSGVLLGRIHIHGNSFRELDPKKLAPECESICAIFKLDWKALQAKALEEIPDPPGWAKLNADGTPKAVKPKATKGQSSPGNAGASKPKKAAKKSAGRVSKAARPKARAGGK